MTAIKNGTLLVKDSNGNTARVATLSQTDITTLNTALTDIEANKRKISSISANYVTTNTAQTIAGAKTFSAVTKSATPAASATGTEVVTAAWTKNYCEKKLQGIATEHNNIKKWQDIATEHNNIYRGANLLSGHFASISAVISFFSSFDKFDLKYIINSATSDSLKFSS